MQRRTNYDNYYFSGASSACSVYNFSTNVIMNELREIMLDGSLDDYIRALVDYSKTSDHMCVF